MPNNNIIQIADAIRAINSEADFSYTNLATDDETIATINWRGTTPISAEDIKAKKAKLEAE
jgi:hypothetical protein